MSIMISLDPKKVEEFSKEHNLSEVSISLGRNRQYLLQGVNGKTRGIRIGDYETIKRNYGVDLQAYREVPPEERVLFRNMRGGKAREKVDHRASAHIFVDKEKLREAWQASGMTKSAFSIDLGKSHYYISNYLSDAESSKAFVRINKSVAELIKLKYGIDIELKELPKPVEEKPEDDDRINSEVPKGQEDIYLAVYFGVQDALKDFLKDFNRKPLILTDAGAGLMERAHK